MHKRQPLTAALGVLLLATSCGGSDEAATSGPCPASPFTGTMTRVSDGTGQLEGSYTTETFANGDTRFIIYDNDISVYISDQEISASLNPKSVDGGVLVYVYLEETGPFEAGDTVTLTGRGPRIDNVGTLSYAMGSIDSTSQATIIAHTDTQLCFDVTYSDDFQTIDGTFSARSELEN